jgi:uncharacterized membrane protein YfcA
MDDFTTIQYIGSSVTALLIGFMTGIFGVGGGFLMTPMLIILLNISGPIAVGTDLTLIFFNSSIGMFKRRGTDTIDVKLALWLAGGGIAGSQLGLLLMHYLKAAPKFQLLGHAHDPVIVTLLSLFLVLLTWIAIFMSCDLKHTHGKAPADRTGLFAKIKLSPMSNFHSLEHSTMSLVPIIVFGFATGILTSLMGVGGGVIMLPALIYLIGQRAVKAAGTSLLFVWIISLVSGLGHLKSNNIGFALLPGMIACGFIGTWWGTNIGLKLKGPRIRLYFIFVVIAAVIMVAFKLGMLLFGTADAITH